MTWSTAGKIDRLPWRFLPGSPERDDELVLRLAGNACPHLRGVPEDPLPLCDRVVIDAASCTNGLLDDVMNYLHEEHRARLKQITLLDCVAWCDSLFPALTVTERIESAAVHPTCSSTHLGLTKTLERLAGRLAGDVLVPVGLDETKAQAYLSANRTREMGLRQATGYPQESLVFLLKELTRSPS